MGRVFGSQSKESENNDNDGDGNNSYSNDKAIMKMIKMMMTTTIIKTNNNNDSYNNSKNVHERKHNIFIMRSTPQNFSQNVQNTFPKRQQY